MTTHSQESEWRANHVHTMPVPLTTPKQKYHALMALVCEDRPSATKIIAAIVRDGPEATSGQLAAVRFGRHVNLTWLIDLVRVSLPRYQIPHELLPALAPVLAATVTLFSVGTNLEPLFS